MAHKHRSETHPLIVALNGVLEKTRLTNKQVGDAIGLSEGGVRFCRKYGWPPTNRLVRKALVRFIAKHDPGAGRRELGESVDA